MPLYGLRCAACKHEFDAFASAAHRYSIPCTQCGATNCDTNFDTLRVKTDEYLYGTRSRALLDGCAPEQVQEMRRKYGDTVNIDDNGEYTFTSKGQIKKYVKRSQEIEQQESGVTQNG